MTINNTKTIKMFEQPITIDCSHLRYIGVYLCSLFLLAFISNLIVIVAFYKNRDLFTPVNTLIFSLIILNLLGSIMEIPIVAISAFKCKYVRKYALNK